MKPLMMRCLSIIQLTLFPEIVRFVFLTNIFLPPVESMPRKRSTLMNFVLTKSSIWASQDYRYEKQPAMFGKETFLSRKAKNKENVCFYGKLANEILTCDKFLLLNVKIWFRLVRS